MIKTGFNAELDDLVQISRDGKGYLAKLEARKERPPASGRLKVRYNKVFGYYIEVPKSRATEMSRVIMCANRRWSMPSAILPKSSRPLKQKCSMPKSAARP